jgi:hypothetical protein
LPVEFGCCEVQGKNFSLNNIHLNLPLNNVVHHLDDLKVANHKAEEVERLTKEQDWKLRHSNMDYHLSFLSYVGMVTTTKLFLFCFTVVAPDVALRSVRIFQGGGKTIIYF